MTDTWKDWSALRHELSEGNVKQELIINKMERVIEKALAHIAALETQAVLDGEELRALRPLGAAALGVGENRFFACWSDWQNNPSHIIRFDADIWPPLIEATKAYRAYWYTTVAARKGE